MLIVARPPQEASAEPPPTITAVAREQPLELMYRLMESEDPRIQLQAAIAAAPYVHPKLMPIKTKANDKEKKPSRFAASAPPRLVSNR